jgi:hypothetical protein
VNHFSGDELVMLFGVPTAHEDHFVRGVRAALDLAARVAAVGESLRARPAPRCGCGRASTPARVVAQRLRSGDRRFRVTGRPMDVAVRLAALAEAGAVLVSPECRRLVAPFVETAPAPPRCRSGRARPRSSRTACSASRAWRPGWSTPSARAHAVRGPVARAARPRGAPRAGARRRGRRRVRHRRRRHGKESPPSTSCGGARSAPACACSWGGVTRTARRPRSSPSSRPWATRSGSRRAGRPGSDTTAPSPRCAPSTRRSTPTLPLYLALLAIPSEPHPRARATGRASGSSPRCSRR